MEEAEFHKSCLQSPLETLRVIAEELGQKKVSTSRKEQLFEGVALCCDQAEPDCEWRVDPALQVCALTALQTAILDRDLFRKSDLERQALKAIVSLGRLLPQYVFDHVFKAWPVGTLPDPYVAQVLGEMIVQRPSTFSSFIPMVLGRAVSILHQVKGAGMLEGSLCVLFCNVADALSEIYGSTSQLPDLYETDLLATYETCAKKWLLKAKRDDELNAAVIRSSCVLLSLLPTSQREAEVKPTLQRAFELMEPMRDVGLLKYALAGVGCLLRRPISWEHDDVAEVLGHFLLLMRKGPNVAILCEEAIIFLYENSPDDVLRWTVGQQCSDTLILDTVRRLVAFSPERLLNEPRKQQLMVWVRPLLKLGATAVKDDLAEVQTALLNLLSAFAQHGFLELEGSNYCVDWVVRVANGENADAAPRIQGLASELLEGCSKSWPEQCARPFWEVLREVRAQSAGVYEAMANCGAELLAKRGDDEKMLHYDRLDAVEHLSGVLVQLARPKEDDQMTLAALHFLGRAGGTMHRSLSAVTGGTGMLTIVVEQTEEVVEKKCARETYEDKVRELTALVVASIDDEQWTDDMAKELVKQIHAIEDDKEWQRAAASLVLHKVSPQLAESEFP